MFLNLLQVLEPECGVLVRYGQDLHITSGEIWRDTEPRAKMRFAKQSWNDLQRRKYPAVPPITPSASST
jgi:hypothetical protein